MIVFCVLIFAMSIFRCEVWAPRSRITGLIPLSKSLRAPKSPAGPEPTIKTVFFPSAFFHWKDFFSVSSGFSPIKTLYRKWNFTFPWRASIDFFKNWRWILPFSKSASFRLRISLCYCLDFILPIFFLSSERMIFLWRRKFFSSSGFIVIKISDVIKSLYKKN